MGRKLDLVIASEHLRNRLHCEQPALIKDRRYHLRIYQNCFVGRDIVDWLIDHLEASNRHVAVRCMRILQDQGIIHHGMLIVYLVTPSRDIYEARERAPYLAIIRYPLQGFVEILSHLYNIIHTFTNASEFLVFHIPQSLTAKFYFHLD